jgi:hypothetical protein
MKQMKEATQGQHERAQTDRSGQRLMGGCFGRRQAAAPPEHSNRFVIGGSFCVKLVDASALSPGSGLDKGIITLALTKAHLIMTDEGNNHAHT